MATRLPVPPRLQPIDQRLIGWMDRHGVRLLRVTIGVVFIWFGALKLFPGASPAAGLIVSTYPFLPPGLFLPFLGCWEMAIGLGYLTGRLLRVTVALMYAQMLGAMSPIVLNPEAVFVGAPFVLTLEGSTSSRTWSCWRPPSSSAPRSVDVRAVSTQSISVYLGAFLLEKLQPNQQRSLQGRVPW